MHPETEAVLPYLSGRVIEIGGGGNPTPGACLSIDHTPGGTRGNAGSQSGVVSMANVAGDMASVPVRKWAFDTLVARHVIEHHYDTMSVLKEWARVAKRLVVIAPDQAQYDGNTIYLDPTHRAAFTPGQLACLAKHAGYDTLIQLRPVVPNWSFLMVAEKTVLFY